MSNQNQNTNDPWYVVALKVAAYLISLLLAGTSGASLAQLGSWNWF